MRSFDKTRPFIVATMLALVFATSSAQDPLAVAPSTELPAGSFSTVIAPVPALAAEALPPPLSPPRFVLLAPSVRQGDPVFAEIVSMERLSHVDFELRDARGALLSRGRVFALDAKGKGSRWGALAGLSWDVEAGRAEARVSGLQAGQSFVVSVPILIEARKFALEDIPLDKANTEIRAVPDPQKTAEALAIQAIYARVDQGELWASLPFVAPVGDARRSAGFGDRRRFLYAGGGSDSAWHSGIDFAVPVGTPVHAPAAGRVLFSGMRIVTGYTMVIEHDPGLYSILMHLSKGIAAEGSLVKAGEVVALSGFTGLATGPHLHWEVRAGEVAVDPDFFVAARTTPFPWLDTAVPPGR